MRVNGIALLTLVAVLAGTNLDSPISPTTQGSQMFTLNDINQRLTSGAAGIEKWEVNRNRGQ